MGEELILCLLFIAPCVFGFAMARLSFWVFDLVIGRLSASETVEVVAKVLGWGLGNGAVVVGGAYLGGLIAALDGVTHGAAVLVLSYLLGFGLGVITRLTHRDRTFVGQLHEYLNGQQIEAVLLMDRYRVTDIATAASRMGVTPDEFMKIYESALKVIRQQWNLKKRLHKEAKDAQARGLP